MLKKIEEFIQNKNFFTNFLFIFNIYLNHRPELMNQKSKEMNTTQPLQTSIEIPHSTCLRKLMM